MNNSENSVLLAKCSSVLGSTIFNTLVSVYIVSVYGNGKILGNVLAVSGVLSVAFSLLGGYLSDNSNKIKLLKTIDLISFLVCIISYLFLGSFELIIILILVLILNVNATFSSPIFKALIPLITARENIERFNIRISSINELIKIVIPVVITYLYQIKLINIDIAIIFNGISFLISYIVLTSLSKKIDENIVVKKIAL